MSRCITLALLALLLVPRLHAGVLVEDDFESYTAATFWVDTLTDGDPSAPKWPLIKETFVIYGVQVVDHPTDLVGPPWAGGAGPTFSGKNGPGDQYLMINSHTYIHNQAWLALDAAAQARITETGKLRVSIDVYKLHGVDGWLGSARITGWDNTPDPGTNVGRAFDILLMPDGTVRNNHGSDLSGTPSVFPASSTVIPGLFSPNNKWQNLVIDVDFATDTFDLSLDGTWATGLTWFGGDLSKLQHISLSLTGAGVPGSPRAGFDNIQVFIPEPATAGAGLGLMVLMSLRTGRRR